MKNNEFSLNKNEKECEKKYGFYVRGLILSKEKDGIKIKSNITNDSILINHFFPGIKFSEFDRRPYLNNNPLKDDDYYTIADKLTKILSIKIKISDVKDAIKLISANNKFNPLSDYFNSMTETKTNYLDNWLTRVFGVKDNKINRIIGRKWLISCVARATKPGCYIEGSLIFYGKQAVSKTWFFKNINPKPEYYCGTNVDISNVQKAIQTYQGKFIIEFAELSSIRKADLNVTKQFLTEPSDTYVPKFENLSVTIPRQMVFGGSTNDRGILTDTTGNRRFWCVEATKDVDQEDFLCIKDLLWAEAYQAFKKGEMWTLTSEERDLLDISNEIFNVDDPFKEFLSKELENYESITAYELRELCLKRYGQGKRETDSRIIAKTILSLKGWDKDRDNTKRGYIKESK